MLTVEVTGVTDKLTTEMGKATTSKVTAVLTTMLQRHNVPVSIHRLEAYAQLTATPALETHMQQRNMQM